MLKQPPNPPLLPLSKIVHSFDTPQKEHFYSYKKYYVWFAQIVRLKRIKDFWDKNIKPLSELCIVL